MMPAIL